MTTTEPTRPTLRERRRSELTAEIKDVARQHLAAEGLAALSLRSVARDVGMAVSALYRYFESREDLVTALLVDAYEAHADAVEEAVAASQGGPTEALHAGLLAFRAWAVERPVEYGLMYGSPLPGYQAPTDRLFRPGTRVGFVLYGLVGDAERSGLLDLERAAARTAALPEAHVAQLEAWRVRRVPHLRLECVVVTVDLWARLQGLVSLEVFGQLRPVLGDPLPYFASTLETALEEAGLALSPSR